MENPLYNPFRAMQLNAFRTALRLPNGKLKDAVIARHNALGASLVRMWDDDNARKQ